MRTREQIREHASSMRVGVRHPAPPLDADDIIAGEGSSMKATNAIRLLAAVLFNKTAVVAEEG